MITIKEAYGKLRSLDIKKEDARYVLPNASTTHIIFTMNLQFFVEFFGTEMWQKSTVGEFLRLYETLDIVLKILPELSEAILDVWIDSLIEVSFILWLIRHCNR